MQKTDTQLKSGAYSQLIIVHAPALMLAPRHQPPSAQPAPRASPQARRPGTPEPPAVHARRGQRSQIQS